MTFTGALSLFSLIILTYWVITELFTVLFRFTGLPDERARFQVISLLTGCGYNDYRMAKSKKAFRRAALLRSKTAVLFCHIILAMSIGRMIQGIIRCQTCRLAAKSIETPIDFANR